MSTAACANVERRWVVWTVWRTQALHAALRKKKPTMLQSNSRCGLPNVSATAPRDPIRTAVDGGAAAATSTASAFAPSDSRNSAEYTAAVVGSSFHLLVAVIPAPHPHWSQLVACALKHRGGV
eukprot:SAG11_NODE_767_length_7273_cov_3.106914_3_plen_123_part_00